MGLIFLIWRFFYHNLSKKAPSLILALKKDCINLYAYAKQIILSNPTRIKIVVGTTICFFFLTLLPIDIDTLDVFEDAASTIIFFLMVVIFAPQDKPSQKKFPVEIFGFIYSILFMYLSAGTLLIDIFYVSDFSTENLWIYGYIITLISYIICIATLSRFMERDLSRMEIIFVGMIMTTILEFITYYGIGFCSGNKLYDEKIWESNTFELITTVINQGIFIASQSQILERSAKEVWGYIILNGTDVLTVTVVLGYVLQKFMGIDSNAK